MKEVLYGPISSATQQSQKVPGSRARQREPGEQVIGVCGGSRRYWSGGPGVAARSRGQNRVYPAHETLGFGVTALDLNHDGIPDFAFCNIAGGDGSTTACTLAIDRARRPRIWHHEPKTFFHFLDVIPPKAESQQNQILGDSKFAYALQPGARVGPKSKFTAGGRVMVSCATGFRSTSCAGRWFDVQHRYLGLKFVINGKIHFGWARLKVSALARNAVLTGYAYETTPNKAILTGATKGPEDAGQPLPASLKKHAPEPATLSALALGAPGLAIWRRED